MNLLASNCCMNLICINDFIASKIELDNVLVVMNTNEIRYLYPTKQVGFDELWNNSGQFWHRPQTLHIDRCKTFHASVFYLKMKGKSVTISCTKLLTLHIYDSSETTNFTKFWGLMVAKFYKSHEGFDMLTIFLFSSWRYLSTPPYVLLL